MKKILLILFLVCSPFFVCSPLIAQDAKVLTTKKHKHSLMHTQFYAVVYMLKPEHADIPEGVLLHLKKNHDETREA